MNDLIIKAVALSLREYPLLNAMVSGDEIRIFPEINVGLAVAMEDGLIVPAIPRADRTGSRGDRPRAEQTSLNGPARAN